MYEHLNTLIDSLAKDHRRGATEIVSDAANLFNDIAALGVDDPLGADQLFARAARRLSKDQPTMAPVLNLLNRVCFERQLAGEDWEACSSRISKYLEDWRGLRTGMLDRRSELPRVDNVLLTFSNSSTVTRLIIACRQDGWNFRVICSEARPVNEGLMMARKLHAADVPVTVYTDAASMSRIEEADAVWVGGDALSHEGLTNKVGSKALAMLARGRGIPFISVMASDKLLPPGMVPYFRFLPQNPREIAVEDVGDIKIVNEYYETIPHGLVTAIYTERGLARPEDLVASIENEPVSELFKGLAMRG